MDGRRPVDRDGPSKIQKDQDQEQDQEFPQVDGGSDDLHIFIAVSETSVQDSVLPVDNHMRPTPGVDVSTWMVAHQYDLIN